MRTSFFALLWVLYTFARGSVWYDASSESYYCVRSLLNINTDFLPFVAAICNTLVTLRRFLPSLALQSYILKAAIKILLFQTQFSFAFMKKLGMCQHLEQSVSL
jgi:hypothetical protein